MNSVPTLDGEPIRTPASLPMEGLHQLSGAVNRAERLEEIYEASIQALRGALAADRASILLYDSEMVMRFVAWQNLSDEYRAAVDGHSPWTPDTADPVPILIDDVRLDASMEDYLPTFDREGIRALGFIPLLYAGRLLGKFMVYFDQLHRFTREEEQLLQTIAHSVAFAIAKRQAEEEVRNLNQQLEERVQQRTAELQKAKEDLESFCYSVSHDLRAPLRGMMSAAMMLLEDYSETLDAEGQDHLRRMSQAAHRMAQLIEDLLQYSRLGRKEIECQPVDLAAIAQQTMDEIKERDASCVHVKFTSQSCGTVNADPQLLEMAVRNLLENACKFSKEKHDACISFVCREESGRLMFSVRDNGVGFDQKYAEKLFRPFERLHPEARYPGTGIGLANVKRIIERHGGEVWAEAEVDRGATFTFTLGTSPCPG